VLVVWEEKNVILDGHHRYEICQKHKLGCDLRLVSPPDLDAAKLWMIEHQLGQRNLNHDQRSYWIGKQYELEKKRVGRPEGKSGQNDHFIWWPGMAIWSDRRDDLSGLGRTSSGEHT
jgi:hypothetical protein